MPGHDAKQHLRSDYECNNQYRCPDNVVQQPFPELDLAIGLLGFVLSVFFDIVHMLIQYFYQSGYNQDHAYDYHGGSCDPVYEKEGLLAEVLLQVAEEP